MSVTEVDTTAMRARVDAATEGPWIAEYSREQGNCVIPHDARSTREAVATTHLYDQAADAEFIAHARTDVPALVATLREAEAKLAAIQGHFDHVYAEDDEGEYGNIPDIYDPDFYRGLDFGLRPIRAILDIAEGS